MGTALLILAAIASVLLERGVTGLSNDWTDDKNKDLADKLKEEYPDLTEDQIENLIDEYGEKYADSIFDVKHYGDQTDLEGLNQLMEDIQKAHELYGDAPKALTSENLAQIQEDAYNEIDAENQKLLDLYNQSFNNSQTQLQDELLEN